MRLVHHEESIHALVFKPTFREGRRASNFRGRFVYWGSLDDVVYGVLYQASDESSFDGNDLVIDGGRTAQ